MGISVMCTLDMPGWDTFWGHGDPASWKHYGSSMLSILGGLQCLLLPLVTCDGLWRWALFLAVSPSPVDSFWEIPGILCCFLCLGLTSGRSFLYIFGIPIGIPSNSPYAYLSYVLCSDKVPQGSPFWNLQGNLRPLLDLFKNR